VKPIPQVAFVIPFGSGMLPLMNAAVEWMQTNGPWVSRVYSPRDWDDLWPRLAAQEFDGVIATIETAAQARRFKSLRVPVVCCSGYLAHTGVPTVRSDDIAAGRLAAEHFLERGFRHFLTWNHTWPEPDFALKRRQGFERRARETGFAVETVDVSGFNPGLSANRRWLEFVGRNLAAMPKPLGVLGTTDWAARIVLEACHMADVAVPDEVSVVGSDNDPLHCRLSFPELSSLDLNLELRARKVVELLGTLMRGEAAPREPVLVQPRGVIARRSSDVFAINNQAVVQAVRHIRDHATESISTRDVVAHVHLPRRTLEVSFRKHLGRSILAEIHRARLSRARRLLEETSMTVESIAVETGFKDLSRMNRLFRKKLAITPGAYRRTYRR
jgi:LacI family transcriptional regulator